MKAVLISKAWREICLRNALDPLIALVRKKPDICQAFFMAYVVAKLHHNENPAGKMSH